MTQNKRPHLGNQIYQFQDNYIVIDIETTGFMYRHEDIIEVCAKKFINRRYHSELKSLINPHKSISPSITRLTGINNQMVSDAPDLQTFMKALLPFIDGFVLVAHNASFDVTFLYDAAIDVLQTPLQNDYFDTLLFARRYINDSPNHKLGTLADHLNIGTPNHRAEQDVDVTAVLYDILYERSKVQKPVYQKKHYENFKPDSFERTVSEDSIDSNNCFYQKNICFSGKMTLIPKTEAAQGIVNRGANLQKSVNAQTHYLILGDVDFQKERFGGKSTKHKRAEELIQLGYEIVILSEEEFSRLLNA